MNHDWETIADSIRAEIADNGRLIQLFDEQQRAIIRGDAGDVLELSNAIQAQVGALASSRRDRQAAVGAFFLTGSVSSLPAGFLLFDFRCQVAPIAGYRLGNIRYLMRHHYTCQVFPVLLFSLFNLADRSRCGICALGRCP